MESTTPKIDDTPRPKIDPRKRTYWYESLAWLIREAPGLLGEQSNMGAVISALTSGGPGQSVASSGGHDDFMDQRIEHVTRVRELSKAFDQLHRETQLVLLVYYEPRNQWPAGCASELGVELASVAIAFAEDRARLLDACSFSSKEENKGIIATAKEHAAKLIAEAHNSWTDVRRVHLPAKDRDDFRARVEAA